MRSDGESHATPLAVFFFQFSMFQYNGYNKPDCGNSKNFDRTGKNANSNFSHFVLSFLVAVSRFVTLGGWEGAMCAFGTLRVLFACGSPGQRDEDLLQQLQLHGLVGIEAS